MRYGPLQGCTLEGDIIPRLIDEIPILAVAAVFAQGTTLIKDAAELRVKESDRPWPVMASQFKRYGGRKITEYADGLEIVGGTTPLKGTEVDSYTDHRIAMSLAIAGLNASNKTIVRGAEAAAISYPDFVATLLNICH